MTDLRVQRVPPAFGGWNTEASPEYLPETQAPLVENLLCRQGKLVMRGSLRTSAGVGLGCTYPASMVYGNNALVLGRSTLGATSGGHVTLTDAGFTVVDPSLALGLTYPVARSIEDANAAYAPGPGQLVRWNGAGLPSAVPVGDAIESGVHLEHYAERVFQAGGKDPATAVSEPNTVFYTRPGGISSTPVLDDWKDSLSGLLNRIQVGRPGDAVVGLGKVDSGLAIFKRSGTWLLRGTGPSTFVVRQVSSEIGCWDANTIVNHEGGCFFLSESGYYWFDGSTISLVSGPVNTAVVAATRASIPEAGGRGTPFTSQQFRGTHAVYLRNNCLLLTIGINGYTTGVSTNYYHTSEFSAVYDIANKTWSKFSSGGLTSSVCGFTTATADGRPLGWQGDRVYYLEDIADPAPTYVGRDTLAATTAVSARWHSRPVRLATPASHAQLHRALLDYRLGLFDSGSASGWELSLVRGDGGTALAAQTLPQETSAYRARAARDAFGETDDVQVRVEWTTDEQATIAELYDATVVYAPARERPSRT